MRPKHLGGMVAVSCAVFFALALSLCAQETAPRHIGLVQDWSQRHIIFSRDALALHPDLIYREPRILQQLIERGQAQDWGGFPAPASISNLPPKSRLGRDWNVTDLGAHLRIDMFPVKFTYDPSAPPNCTNDFVVIGLPVAGSATQANLVAFNNLYVNDAGTGLCPGDAPNVMFAYNVSTGGGGVFTTPVLSENGTQIAFVESGAGSGGPAIFHVLTWTAGQGSIGNPATPATMSSVTLSSTVSSTLSSPWVDYASDAAYVGTNKGAIYQVTPVFNGSPELGGAPWPVTPAAYNVTAPVLDSSRGLLMVGSGNGNLYQIDVSTGTVVGTIPIGEDTSDAILAPPIVDVTNGTTFVVDPDNGSSAVLVQIDTSSFTVMMTASLGIGASGGTAVHLYEPAFSYDYFNSPSTGVVSLCGTGATTTAPYQYEFGFTGITLNPTPVTGYPVELSSSTTDRCTGWTEFFNPNVGPADTITATSILADTLTVVANNSFVVGEAVFLQGTDETFLNGQTVTVTSLIGAGPTYTGFTANFTASSYSNLDDTGTVSPIDPITATSITSNVLTVTANNSNLTVGEAVYLQGTAEDFLNGQTVTVASLIGSGPPYTGFTANFTAANYSNPTDTGVASVPTDFFFFGLTGDCTLIGGVGASTTGCVVALANNNGTTTTTTAAVDGGPSGIVVDNYSTATAASSIYLMSLTQDTAYKFTQEGLQ